MGIEALEVIIGLIFIYLLFSLFLSILNEMLSSIFQIRGKELSFAIEQMLSRNIKKKIFEHERVRTSKYRSSHLYGTPLWKIYLKWKKRSKKIDLHSNNPSDKVTNHVLPSHISTENFSSILMGLYQDEEKRSELFKNVPYLEKLAKDVDWNAALLKNEIEEWYDEVMAYTTEWYKQKLRYILLILGFLTALIFNIDSIAIFKTLATDTEARTQIVNQAQGFIESHRLEDGIIITAYDTTNSETAYTDTITSGLALRNFLDRERNKCRGNDSIPCLQSLNSNYPTLVKIDSTYQQMDKLLNNDINQLSSSMGLGWDFSELQDSDNKFKDFFRLFWRQSGLLGIFGWMITALALSLGAPFWFDMLKKVVNMKNELANRKKEKSNNSAKE